jgi:hypothetical protein
MKYGDLTPGDTVFVNNSYHNTCVWYFILGISDVSRPPSPDSDCRTFHVLVIFLNRETTVATTAVETRHWFLGTDLPDTNTTSERYLAVIRGSDA